MVGLIILSISNPEKGHILDCDQLQVVTESKTTIWLLLGSLIQDFIVCIKQEISLRSKGEHPH